MWGRDAAEVCGAVVAGEGLVGDRGVEKGAQWGPAVRYPVGQQAVCREGGLYLFDVAGEGRCHVCAVVQAVVEDRAFYGFLGHGQECAKVGAYRLGQASSESGEAAWWVDALFENRVADAVV